MIAWGAKFAWFFTYMPVGVNAVPELLATAEQRKLMVERIRAFHKTKPLFTMDFWNDGEYVDGCIAGGRRYLHINANGDFEPCAFIHYFDSNLREKTLLEALHEQIGAVPLTAEKSTAYHAFWHAYQDVLVKKEAAEAALDAVESTAIERAIADMRTAAETAAVAFVY